MFKLNAVHAGITATLVLLSHTALAAPGQSAKAVRSVPDLRYVSTRSVANPSTSQSIWPLRKLFYGQRVRQGTRSVDQLVDEQVWGGKRRLKCYRFENPKGTGGYVFEPLASPDGQTVAFKFGEPAEGTGQYKLYLFNTRTHRLLQLHQRWIRHKDVQFSPDGRYLAYTTGGASFGTSDPALGEMELWLWDTKLNSKVRVAQGDSLEHTITWLPPRKRDGKFELAYGLTKQVREDSTTRGVPNAYAYDPSTKRTRILLDYADTVKVSPDFNWMLYAGPQRIDGDYSVTTENFALRLQAQGRDARLFIAPAKLTGDGIVPIVYTYWTPDSRYLLSLVQQYKKYEDQPSGPELARYNALLIDPANYPSPQNFRIVAPIHVRSHRSDMDVECLGFVPDSKSKNKALIGVRSYNGVDIPSSKDTTIHSREYRLLTLDLETGATAEVLKISGVNGISGMMHELRPTTLLNF